MQFWNWVTVNASPASYAGTNVDWVQRHANSDRDSLRRLYLQCEYASSTNDTNKKSRRKNVLKVDVLLPCVAVRYRVSWRLVWFGYFTSPLISRWWATIGHSFKSTPTNGPRYSAPGVPWWSPIQSTNRVCLDVTCRLPYIGNAGFQNRQNVLFGNAPDVRLFSRPTCSGTRSIPHGRAWSMTSPQHNPNYRLLITTVWAERPQRRARLLQLTGKSVTVTGLDWNTSHIFFFSERVFCYSCASCIIIIVAAAGKLMLSHIFEKD
jgi:hypothetical protein